MPRVEYKRQFSIEFLFGTILERGGAGGIENAATRAEGRDVIKGNKDKGRDGKRGFRRNT